MLRFSSKYLTVWYQFNRIGFEKKISGTVSWEFWTRPDSVAEIMKASLQQHECLLRSSKVLRLIFIQKCSGQRVVDGEGGTRWETSCEEATARGGHPPGGTVCAMQTQRSRTCPRGSRTGSAGGRAPQGSLHPRRVQGTGKTPRHDLP